MSKVFNGSILSTRAADGTTLLWAVCRGCGHIDEVAPSRVKAFERQPYCGTCEDEAAVQAEWGAAARLCADSDLL